MSRASRTARAFRRTDYPATSDDTARLLAAIRVALQSLDPSYRANVAQLADELGVTRQTLYNWADRILAAARVEMELARTGRPNRELVLVRAIWEKR